MKSKEGTSYQHPFDYDFKRNDICQETRTLFGDSKTISLT